MNMENKDYRTPEGKEKSKVGAKTHMASIMSDPEKRAARIAAMQEGRRKTFAELKRLREIKKTEQIENPA